MVRMAVRARMAVTVAVLLLSAGVVRAQSAGAPAEANAQANANNPLANMVAFNVQHYWLADLYDTDQSASTTWLRYARPFGRWLMRASLPFPTVPRGGGLGSLSGVGDFNVFASYLLSDPSAPRQYGVGPLLVAPTAGDDALGADVWQAGAAAVYFDASSPVVQWGGLLTAQTDFAGSGGDTGILVMQPFLFLQFGKGTYWGTAPLWVFDLESGDYNVPLGCRLGKVVASGRTVFNVFLEPQFTMLHDGGGQPQFQLFTGINMQFQPR